MAEWATRSAHFGRMVARAYPGGDAPAEIGAALDEAWRLRTAPRGSRARWRRTCASSRRSSGTAAVRAEIGRKVEELAQEESRPLREAATENEVVGQIRERLSAAERNLAQGKAQADQAERQGHPVATLRAVFERAGQMQAFVDARREALAEHELRAAKKDSQARDLRRQIEDLRAQLARYAEAMEDELTQGRERVAVRTREGIQFERGFTEASDVLLRHLRGRPECRDLVEELSRNEKPAQA
ncbi:MAG: hypothetical protein R3A48_13870 [Polyangiales bacterium]